MNTQPKHLGKCDGPDCKLCALMDRAVTARAQGRRQDNKPQIDRSSKPRVTFDQLARARRSCIERKALGLPCELTEQAVPVHMLAHMDQKQSYKWEYGVTTVPDRADNLLKDTLLSLQRAGFDKPRVFADGMTNSLAATLSAALGLEVTTRYPAVGLYGHWALSLGELYLRNPQADRYAIFQDDLVMCKGVRSYLDCTEWPKAGYLNLFSYRESEYRLANKPTGWHEGAELEGGKGEVYHGRMQQAGRGALALCFTREGVVALLTHHHMVASKPRDAKTGWRKADGAIVQAMNMAGWREWVHNPSLVQHTGLDSTIGNRRNRVCYTFPGEDFDAMRWVQAKHTEATK